MQITNDNHAIDDNKLLSQAKALLEAASPKPENVCALMAGGTCPMLASLVCMASARNS